MMCRRAIVLLLSLTLMVVSTINDVSAASNVCTSCLEFTVREPNLIYGPTADRNLSCNIPAGSPAPIDQPVESIYFSPNDAKVFTGNVCTYVFRGTEIGNAINIYSTPVLGPGPYGSFDSGGTWITAAARCGGVDNVVAWYHAEQPAGSSTVHKSIGIATSANRGLSFSRLGYQILNDGSSTSLGIGDHSVVEIGNYYYIYFINHTAGTVLSVARALKTSCGRIPSDWKKYCNGSWTCDALTGSASNILSGRNPWSLSAGHLDLTSDTSIMVASNQQGIELLFSNDGINFVAAPDRLHPIAGLVDGQNRSMDKLWYPSMIGQDQENRWASGFWFYYMLTFGPTVDRPNGETVSEARRQVRRWVDVTLHSQPITGPKVKIALARYFRASNTDHAASIELPEPGYVYESTLGYLATEQYTGMVKVEECWWPNWGGWKSYIEYKLRG